MKINIQTVFRSFFPFVIALMFISCVHQNKLGQVSNLPQGQALYDTIKKQDSLLFVAFNARNFEKFKNFFTPELVIYQDNTGVRNYKQSMEAFQSLFKGNYILTRNLVGETLEVYPIKDFGAIETGQHTFCHTENGKPDCGTFKFVHIWEFKKGEWKIVKIITYNH
ncbi:MAG: nuclear transport factor 2 family protein [Bacteroidales bacterium]